MLICDDFQLVNQFSERNDNSHKEIITFEIHEVVAQRLALAAVGGRVDKPSKRKKLKARKTPKKRAAYPPSAARIVRQPF